MEIGGLLGELTGAAPEPQLQETAAGRRWRAQEQRIELRGASYRLRLISFAAGWLASVDSVAPFEVADLVGPPQPAHAVEDA